MEPKIRFKGFEEEWKAPLFSEMVERISASGQAGMLPGVEFEDIASGEGCFNKNIFRKNVISMESYSMKVIFFLVNYVLILRILS